LLLCRWLLIRLASMSLLLSNRQKEELNKAILDYLNTNGYKETVEALRKEANVELDSKSEGSLEKKWTSILRLQKKIVELESKVAQLEEESTQGTRKTKENPDALPRPPAKYTLTGHRMAITAVKFHPLYSQLASSSEDATIKVWDSESGELERTLKGHINAVQAVAFDASGAHLASCSADLTIKVWNTGTWECIKTLKGHDHNVTGVVFTPSGDHLISCSRDKTIRVWELQTGYCTKTLEGHEEWVRKVIVSDDGATIASCSNDQTIRLWSFSTGECVQVLRDHSHVVENIAFSPANCALVDFVDKARRLQSTSGKFLASASRDRSIKVWDVVTGQLLMTLLGHDNWVRAVIFHPNGKHLLSVSDDKSIRVWELKEVRCLKSLEEAHSHFIGCADLKGRDAQFASGGVDNVVKVWSCR